MAGNPIATNGAPTVLSDTSGTITIDARDNSQQAVTLTGTGRALTIKNPVAGQILTLEIAQDGTGSRTITSWNGVTWAAATAPTLTTTAGAVDVVRLTYNSTTSTWRGELVGKAFA